MCWLCRYDLFYTAFKHVSDSIDGIYKELTKNVKAKTAGGTAYLTLENAEVRWAWGCTACVAWAFAHMIPFLACPLVSSSRTQRSVACAACACARGYR